MINEKFLNLKKDLMNSSSVHNSEKELLKREIENKNVIIEILNKQLNSIQEILKYLTSPKYSAVNIKL